MNKSTIITILSTFILTVMILYSFGFINKNTDDKISKLNDVIDTLEEENKRLKDDKQFYKNNYINMAKEYENRLHQLGINEYILTDTER